MKKTINTIIGSALLATTVAAKKPDSNFVSQTTNTNSKAMFIVEWDNIAVGGKVKNLSAILNYNLDDEFGLGVTGSYKINDNLATTIWLWASNKKNVGDIYTGAGWVTAANENWYIGASVLYKKFDPSSSLYTNSDSLDARVHWGYKVLDNFTLTASVGQKRVYAEWCNTVKWTVWHLGANIDLPYDITLSPYVKREINKVKQYVVWLQFTIKFWKGSPKTPNETSYLLDSGIVNMERYFLTESSNFDNSMVMSKKTKTPEALPAQTVNIVTSAWIIRSWDNSDNIVAENLWWDVIIDLTVNSPYTLSVNQFTFNPQLWGTSETKTANILNKWQIVWTKSVTVTWQ